MIIFEHPNRISGFVLSVLMFLSYCASAQPAAPAGPRVNRDQALSAYARFSDNPLTNIDAAPTFIQFIQTDGEVHIVLDPKLLPWMYEDYAAEVRAVLYAAYMGGNMSSQLLGKASGDDPVSGIRSVLDAYRALQDKDDSLEIPLLETLAKNEAAGTLSEAIAALDAPPR